MREDFIFFSEFVLRKKIFFLISSTAKLFTKLDLNNRFKYSEKVVNTEGTLQPYLEYNYKGFPMIASISKLTKIQTDIRYVENKVLTQILDAVQNKGLNFSTFQTLLETTKPVYYTSDVIDAAVVMVEV